MNPQAPKAISKVGHHVGAPLAKKAPQQIGKGVQPKEQKPEPAPSAPLLPALFAELEMDLVSELPPEVARIKLQKGAIDSLGKRGAAG
jgi:hypothetical protein